MSDTSTSAEGLPLRQSDDGKWEVENVPGNWITCETEEDARIFSNGPIVLEESFRTTFPDKALAARLEKTAEILEQYKIGFTSRYLRNRAKLARGEDS